MCSAVLSPTDRRAPSRTKDVRKMHTCGDPAQIVRVHNRTPEVLHDDPHLSTYHTPGQSRGDIGSDLVSMQQRNKKHRFHQVRINREGRAVALGTHAESLRWSEMERTRNTWMSRADISYRRPRGQLVGKKKPRRDMYGYMMRPSGPNSHCQGTRHPSRSIQHLVAAQLANTCTAQPPLASSSHKQ